jgi:dihydroxy-acid dehydratase
MSVEEFNYLSTEVVPVIVDARPFGKFSMVDIDEKGGIQVFVKDLLDAGLLNGNTMTCTGVTLSDQLQILNPVSPDGEVIYSVETPFKQTGGLRLLGGNLSPEFSAVLKLAGVEGGLENNVFNGSARVFDGEKSLLSFLDETPGELANNDMIIVRYEGPIGGPGMPEMLDSTSRITAICRERNIVVGLMTDGRFSGGSVGLVIGHVGPEAAVGGAIALVEDGDSIEVNLNKNELNCEELSDHGVYQKRQKLWTSALDSKSNMHPSLGLADTRLLNRMRESAVSAVYGAGMHPNGKLWIPHPRQAIDSKFIPKNKYKQVCN